MRTETFTGRLIRNKHLPDIDLKQDFNKRGFCVLNGEIVGWVKEGVIKHKLISGDIQHPVRVPISNLSVLTESQRQSSEISMIIGKGFTELSVGERLAVLKFALFRVADFKKTLQISYNGEVIPALPDSLQRLCEGWCELSANEKKEELKLLSYNSK